MAIKVKTRAVLKGKKKHWYSIVASDLFNDQYLGEISLYDASLAIGRHITVSQMNLTGDIKSQNTNIIFRINKVKEGNLYAEIIGEEIMPTAMKRLARRRTSKISDSFITGTSDNKEIKIKPVLITRSNINRSIQTRLRKTSEEIIRTEVKKLNFLGLMESIISHRFQTSLKHALSKVYPIRIVEIKELILYKKARPGAQAEAPLEVSTEAPKAEENAEAPKEASEEKPKEEKAEEAKEEKPKKEKKEKKAPEQEEKKE